MKKYMLLLPLALLLGFITTPEDWSERPFMQWTEKEVRTVLRDSPWVKNQRVQVLPPLPVRQRSEPSEGSGTSEVTLPEIKAAEDNGGITYTIHFLSALPIRQALARLSVLKGSADSSQAEAFVGQETFLDQIVVAVGSETSGVDFREFLQVTEAELQDSSYLQLRKSGRKIYLQRYLSPAESGNGQPLFVFPRPEGEELIRLEERAVTFVAPINRDLHLEQTFQLNQMLFQGKLAL